MKIERNEIIKYLTTVSLSSLANSASALAVYWYVLETTASVETLIMAGILQSLPTVFAFIIANIAKGKSSRFFMWVSDAIRAVLFIALFLTCDLKYAVWIVIVINIVLHVLEQLRTTATTTIIAELNEKQTKYGIWVGMSNGIKSIFELIGVASCGYFFEKIGYKFTFISIALFFILSTVVSFTIKENAEITEDAKHIRPLSMLKQITHNVNILGIITLAVIISTVFSPLEIILTSFVHTILKKGALFYGIVDGLLMFGMIVGAFLFSFISKKIQNKKLLSYILLFCAVIFISLSIFHDQFVFSFLILLLGISLSLIDSTLDLWLLRIIPQEGRIAFFALISFLLALTSPLGNILLSYMVNIGLISVIFIIFGVIILVALLFSVFLINERND